MIVEAPDSLLALVRLLCADPRGRDLAALVLAAAAVAELVLAVAVLAGQP